mmetsp:Transcript_6841/g.11642  ORF Transcript_6841/g.11642 Transcript_6841/m.11642 type:complete len:461 (+) Transcript_6841:119-1501(+)
MMPFPLSHLFCTAKADSDRGPGVRMETRPDSITFITSNSPNSGKVESGKAVGAALTIPRTKFTALPFTSIGSQSKEVLYGARGAGIFQLDHKIVLSSKTSTGTSLSSSAVRKGAGVLATVMAVHSLPGTGTKLTGMANSAGGLELEAMYKIAEGTMANTTITATPSGDKLAFAGKLGLEMAGSGIHFKGTATMEPEPLLTMTWGTGTGNLQLGADVTFSTARAALSAQEGAVLAKQGADGSSLQAGPAALAARATGALLGGIGRWTAAVGWTQNDHQVALSVSDVAGSGSALSAKLAYAVQMAEGVKLGAEAVRELPLSGPWGAPLPITYSLGMAAKVSSLLAAADVTRDQVSQVLDEKLPKEGDALADDRSTSGFGARNANAKKGIAEGSKQHEAAGVSPTALVKVRLDSRGTMQALYSDKLLTLKGTGTGVQVTCVVDINMLQAMAKPPRVGITLELV